jgi:hypothetical protein
MEYENRSHSLFFANSCAYLCESEEESESSGRVERVVDPDRDPARQRKRQIEHVTKEFRKP